MGKFEHLTKQAFEAYHNMPYPPAQWSFTDAVGFIMQFLEHHDSVDEMPGLRAALQAMTPTDWATWRDRYPEARAELIDPLHAEISALNP